ncbi:CRISPR-associated endonuclease Cas2 [Candidatus Berkelbacteria bacterium]|nr:CRISPR-associated endonuclease Cas2 [Candidatus Berkelbacteria bacterium]
MGKATKITSGIIGPEVGHPASDLLLGASVTVRQILLSLFDVERLLQYRGQPLNTALRHEIRAYWQWRRKDRQRFLIATKRLTQRGLLRIYHKGKTPVLALTPQGEEYAAKLTLENMTASIPPTWDRKWRLVIFDIPEKHRLARDVFRKRLQTVGFYHIQRSVFIYPFEVGELVLGLRYRFLLSPREVQYILADRIEDENLLIEHFLEQGILQKHHFAKKAEGN